MGQKAEKRIKMILKDGTLSGWVEADDGSIELCHCSRSDASEKQFQNQMKDKAGVYILYSDKNIYAGRTNNLSERIRNHLNEKTFWTNVVTLSKKNMDPTMLALCEGELIEKSQSARSLTCLNKKPKDHANVDSFQKSEAEEFI